MRPYCDTGASKKTLVDVSVDVDIEVVQSFGRTELITSVSRVKSCVESAGDGHDSTKPSNYFA